MVFNLINLLFFILAPAHPDEGLRPHVLHYIDTHQWMAIDEMVQFGIPASVIMAQAIVESNGGTSRLARESNNHFGIKCKSYWAGFTYYMPDDDRDAQGNLIPSCFRQYVSVLDSYRDHSVFLLYTPHYSPLFAYERTDYKRWANGLQACGYATDPRYAEKLIKTIELYQLNELDLYTVQYVERNDLTREP